jgi:hypothetical protein
METRSQDNPLHPHLFTGSHGVGSKGPNSFNVIEIDESLTIPASYSIEIE